MPITATWLIKDEVILVTMSGHVTTEEIQANSSFVTEMLRSVEHPVFLISDDAHITNQPDIRAFRLNREDTETNYDAIISVGQKTPILRLFAQTIARLFRKRILFYNTLPEALEYIYDQKPELRGRELEIQIVSE